MNNEGLNMLSGFRLTTLITLLVMLAGCGKSLSGTYEDKKAGTGLTFKSNGDVVLHSFRTNFPTTYLYAGDTIKIEVTLTKVIFAVNDDGTISGPAGMHFSKVAD